MIIENWSVVGPDDPYVPPENRIVYVRGQVYGHYKHVNGTKIRTSHVIRFNQGLITTANGSLYELGEPDPEYVQWCKDNKHFVPTKENPCLNQADST